MASASSRALATAPPSPPRSPALRVDMFEDAVEPVTVYKIVMTPINFLTFLVSLVLVDIHYRRLRMHTHAESRGRLPSWLHDLLYRRHPYEDPRRQSSESHEPWYYHSKQKKLMRMEAEDAFRLRGTVLAGLAVVLAAGTTATLYSLKLLVLWLWV